MQNKTPSLITVFFVTLLSLSLLIGLSCCHKKQEVQPTDTGKVEKDLKQEKETPSETTKPIKDEDLGEKIPATLQNVYFEYDKSDLTTETRNILTKHGQSLKKNSAVQVLIEGHCDERGSVEYNLALGERRALSAKNFLIAMGVDAKNLKTISYGEEKPIDPGHAEAAWERNRRDEFKIQK